MAGPFRSFVVLGAMRTGSNLLEARLNAIDGVTCHGEAFNPNFVGYPKRADLMGISLAERDADPAALLARLRSAPGLNGFRFFPEHEPRILPAILDDPTCAKIVLTRNPAESYASLAIARATGQWKLTDARDRRSAAARFDREEFMDHVGDLAEFYGQVRHALQVSGQSAFWIDYSELGQPEVLDGLCRFLGVEAALAPAGATPVPQNPEPMEAKVANFPAMAAALADIDPFALFRQPVFEPPRGASVPEMTAARAAPVLFIPIRGGPNDGIRDWLAAAGQAGVDRSFTQKTLRHWMRARPGHAKFTVLWHPVLRAMHAFEGLQSAAPERRDALARYGVIFPQPGMPAETIRDAFRRFIEFLRANLSGQTGIRTHPEWSTQAALLQGISSVAFPDFLFRGDDSETPERMRRLLPGMAEVDPAPYFDSGLRRRASAIYDASIESAVSEAYARDYAAFGFAPWRVAEPT